jgi:hypothetical protein
MRQAVGDGTILVLVGMIRRKSGSGRSTDVSTEENKRVSWRLQEEVFGQGKPELVDELLAPDYVSHAPGPRAEPRTRGHQGPRTRVPLGFPRH